MGKVRIVIEGEAMDVDGGKCLRKGNVTIEGSGGDATNVIYHLIEQELLFKPGKPDLNKVSFVSVIVGPVLQAIKTMPHFSKAFFASMNKIK